QWQRCDRWCLFFSSRRRHTRFSRDWSSDVCSSDLPAENAAPAAGPASSWRPGPRPCRSRPENLIHRLLPDTAACRPMSLPYGLSMLSSCTNSCWESVERLHAKGSLHQTVEDADSYRKFQASTPATVNTTP